MKVYEKENGSLTFIIPETQEESERIKETIYDQNAVKELRKKAEIVPEIVPEIYLIGMGK